MGANSAITIEYRTASYSIFYMSINQPKDFLPVLYGDVRVDALVAEVVDVGAQVFPGLLHVVEGGREVCLEDAHTLLDTNDSVLMILILHNRIQVQEFENRKHLVPKTSCSPLLYSIILHVLYMWTRSSRMVRASNAIIEKVLRSILASSNTEESEKRHV